MAARCKLAKIKILVNIKLSGGNMSSNIIGCVLDNSRRPVDKAKISYQGKIVAVSEKDGSFLVPMIKDENRAALTFTKEGFVTNTKIFNSKAQGKRIIIIWPIAYQCGFNPLHDLDITLGGSCIQIPSNALVGMDGKKIKEKANLQFTLFDVTDRFQCSAATGDFTGVMPNGKAGRLNSYGVFSLGVYDPKGKPLKLRRGAAADLSIPVPPKLIKTVPQTVGYFVMDTTSGMWNQLSDFNLTPKTFLLNGNINRLGGEHNLDNWQDTACVTIKVVKAYYLTPVPNSNVEVTSMQYNYTAMTNSNGSVCLCVSKNSDFQIEAYGGLEMDNYHTIQPYTFHSPDIVSDLNNCGDPVLCPLLGTVEIDLAVGC
jgi:hypothetical protein